MAAWCNWSTHYTVTVESRGSSPLAVANTFLKATAVLN